MIPHFCRFEYKIDTAETDPVLTALSTAFAARMAVSEEYLHTCLSEEISPRIDSFYLTNIKMLYRITNIIQMRRLEVESRFCEHEPPWMQH